MNWHSAQTIEDDSIGLRRSPFNKAVIIGFVLYCLALPLVCRWIGDQQFGHEAPSAASIISTPAVQSKLKPAEQILWSSNVDVDKRADESMVGAYFGLAFTFVGAFGIAAGLFGRRGAARVSWLRILFLVPFLAAGLFLNAGPYWMHKQSMETVCMLTDTRALELQSGRVIVNQRYTRHNMVSPEYLPYSPSRGNVLFYYIHKRRDLQGFRGVTDGEAALAIIIKKMQAFKSDQ